MSDCMFGICWIWYIPIIIGLFIITALIVGGLIREFAKEQERVSNG